VGRLLYTPGPGAGDADGAAEEGPGEGADALGPPGAEVDEVAIGREARQGPWPVQLRRGGIVSPSRCFQSTPPSGQEKEISDGEPRMSDFEFEISD